MKVRMRSKRRQPRRAAAQAGDLFGVLDLAQFGDQRVYSDEEGAAQLGGDGLAHAVQGGDGGLRLIEPQRLTAAAAIHSQASVSGGLVAITTSVPTASALAWAM